MSAGFLAIRSGLAVAALLAAQQALGAGVVIGPMCLDGAKGTSRPKEVTVVPSGTWTPRDFTILDGHPSPRIAIFAKAIPESDILETCEQTQARMAAAGVRTLLSGRMTALKLRALIFDGPSGNRVQINPGALKVTLSSVDAGEHRVAGGTLRLVGSRLWVTSRKEMLSSRDGIKGILEVEAWDRPINGAKVTLPGGLQFVADVRPRGRGNLSINLDLGSDTASLQTGDLVGQLDTAAASTGDALMNVLRLESATLSADFLGINAREGNAQVTLENISGKAASSRIPEWKLQWSAAASTLLAKSLQAPAAQGPNGLAVGAVILRKLVLSGESLQALGTSNQALASGTGTVTAELLSAERLDLKGNWPTPALTALAALFPNGKVAPFELGLSGTQASLKASLRLGASAMAIGGLEVQRPTTLASALTPIDTSLRLPIDVSVPAASGKVEFKDKNRDVALEASLEALKLRGTLVLSIDDLAQSRLEVPKAGFQLMVSSAVSVSPFLAGTRPNFASVRIDVSNATDLVAAKASSGQLLLSTGVIVLGEPVFKVGEGGSKSPASLSLTSEGGVKLHYGLDDSKIGLAQGKFRVRDARFKLIGPAPRVLDLNGDLLTDPELEIKELLLEVDKLGPVALERGRMDKLKVSAASLARLGKADQPNGIAYSGRVSQPLELDSLLAAQLKFDDEVVLGGLELQKLRFGLAGASFGFGKDASLEHASVNLSVDNLRQLQTGSQKVNVFGNAAIAVDGKLRVHAQDFAVNDGVGTKLRLRASGPENKLSGNGSLELSAFTGHARSNLDIDFKCKNSDKLKVPIEFNIAMAGSSFSADLKEGVLSAEGQLAPFGFLVHTVGDGAGCNSPTEKLVVAPAQRGWTWGVCSKNIEVYRCKWEWSTPEISFAYNIRFDVKHLGAPVVMTNPRLFYRDGKMAFCNVGVFTVGAVTFIGGYAPQIETPFGGDGEKLVNGIIAASFMAPQSLAGTAVLSGAGWLVSVVGTVGGNLKCIGKV